MVAVGALLGLALTTIGLDQVQRWLGSATSALRAAGADSPESRNWSGYEVRGGTFTAVSATWTVPRFEPDSPPGADAIWVGIGGVLSNDLVQAGTQATVSRRASTEYQAWVETLPQPSRPVPLPVNAGDSVTVSLQEQAAGSWLVMFINNTSGKTYQLTTQYSSSRSSAEWVVEAPSARRGRTLPLDTFGSVSFTQASTVKDGQTDNIAQAGGHAITMVGRRGEPLARPSALGEDGTSFDVLQSLL
jgi:hypothetical protein